MSKVRKKHLIPNRYYRFLVGRIKQRLAYNLLIDRLAKPVSFDDLGELRSVEITQLDLNIRDLEDWTSEYYPNWRDIFACIRHKKLIEFFATFTLLDVHPDDVFMDAAGGELTYVQKLQCTQRYMQSLVITPHLISFLGNGIEYVESDAGEIPLPDESINKISCHHSFEHFQATSDTSFINEVQRLLKIGGKCCIIPVLIANSYVEVTNAFALNKKFDDRSKRLIDPTANIPGGFVSGNYARIYDLRSFQERVLDKIDFLNFRVTIAQLRLDGEAVPDLASSRHKYVSAINRPYRVLMIERLGQR